jgi:hypothetical protein
MRLKIKKIHQIGKKWTRSVLILFLAMSGRVEAAKFLFDATKAEMAGNADWVIDADNYNLNVTSGNGSGRVMSSSSYDSNPQRFPNPLQSGITSSTLETYWQGALSSWAVDLVQAGHQVETLPFNGKITYGDSTNTQDLSNYDVFVLVEPNILFTAAEKTALINYVKNGGGLLMVADHGHLTAGTTGSDRNNDGADSVDVLNDLMINSVQNNPFGVSFNGDEISGTFTYMNTISSDPLIRGAAGTVNNIKFNVGSSITINTGQNASVTIAIWSSSSRSTSTGVVAYGSYGSGRFAAFGDSSPFDDGTGDNTGDTLYSSYNVSSYGNSKVILNASFWLAEKPPEVTTGTAVVVGTNSATLNGLVNPNGLSTTAKFLYGTTTNYGSVMNVSGTLSGTNATNVSVGLTGLSTGTTYHYALVATNSAGSAQGADQSFTTWTALQAWRQQWFGTTSNSGSAADTYVSSGDGISNLMKYALGLNPLAFNSNPITFSLSGNSLTMTVPRSSSSTGITYFLESTEDLTGVWSSSSVVIDVDTPTLLKGHDINPVSGTSRRFMRLRVTQP